MSLGERVLVLFIGGERCPQSAVRVIPPGDRHWALLWPDRLASSLFVKSNVKFMSGVRRCVNCAYLI